ncbi:hypothetical protein HK101_009552 [Irineochytrium annulatum]|nr:hypothetical protein HK101_009552 [Irineochytrium annulatum]
MQDDEDHAIPAANVVVDESKLLGRGGYGDVFAGRYGNGNVAVKVPRKKNEYTTAELERIRREIATLASLRPHTNVVAIYGFVKETNEIVTELSEIGSLADYYQTHPMIPITDRIRLALDVAEGMTFLHSSRPTPILRHELKGSNVLLVRQGGRLLAKVTIFGLAVAKAWSVSEVRTSESFVGSQLFIDPAFYHEPIKYDALGDVFSFAVVLTELASWEGPYGFPMRDFPWDWFQRCMQGPDHHKHRPPLNKLAEDVPPAFLELIASCWDPVRENRPLFANGAIRDFLTKMVEDKKGLSFHTEASNIPRNVENALLVIKVSEPEVEASIDGRLMERAGPDSALPTGKWLEEVATRSVNDEETQPSNSSLVDGPQGESFELVGQCPDGSTSDGELVDMPEMLAEEGSNEESDGGPKGDAKDGKGLGVKLAAVSESGTAEADCLLLATNVVADDHRMTQLEDDAAREQGASHALGAQMLEGTMKTDATQLIDASVPIEGLLPPVSHVERKQSSDMDGDPPDLFDVERLPEEGLQGSDSGRVRDDDERGPSAVGGRATEDSDDDGLENFDSDDGLRVEFHRLDLSRDVEGFDSDESDGDFVVPRDLMMVAMMAGATGTKVERVTERGAREEGEILIRYGNYTGDPLQKKAPRKKQKVDCRTTLGAPIKPSETPQVNIQSVNVANDLVMDTSPKAAVGQMHSDLDGFGAIMAASVAITPGAVVEAPQRIDCPAHLNSIDLDSLIAAQAMRVTPETLPSYSSMPSGTDLMTIEAPSRAADPFSELMANYSMDATVHIDGAAIPSSGTLIHHRQVLWEQPTPDSTARSSADSDEANEEDMTPDAVRKAWDDLALYYEKTVKEKWSYEEKLIKVRREKEALEFQKRYPDAEKRRPYEKLLMEQHAGEDQAAVAKRKVDALHLREYLNILRDLRKRHGGS